MLNLKPVFLFLFLAFLMLWVIPEGKAQPTPSEESVSQPTGEVEEADAFQSIEKEIEEEFDREESEAEAEQDEGQVESIKITGSRIRRIDMEGPSPVIIYTKEDIENSGYSSAGDFLRDTTITHSGVSRSLAINSNSGESFTAIKGLKTLVLINGLRVAENTGGGQSVDLNMIPLFAIERVEILADGGSALYGSDAVGGVINFITKKNFSGLELHAQVAPTLLPEGFPGGSRYNFGFNFGDTGDGWSYIGSFHLNFQEILEEKDRKWSRKNIASSKGVPYYGRFKGLKDGRTTYVYDPRCGNHPSVTYEKGECTFNVADSAAFLPQHLQIYGYLKGDYRFFGENTLYLQLIGSYKNVQSHLAPSPTSPDKITQESQFAVRVPWHEPNNPLKDHEAFQHIPIGGFYEGPVDIRFMEGGNRETVTDSYILDITTGLRGYISSTWDYDSSIKVAHIIQNQNQKNLLLLKELDEAVKSGAYNLFNIGKRDLSGAVYTAKSKYSSSLLFGSLDLSGESGFWDIDTAIGFQAYFKNYDNKEDENLENDRVFSSTGSSGYGDRGVLSSYLETRKNFGEILETQLAGRVDYYSDFGLTFNPKFSFKLQPHSNISFRGSVGTAFIAPTLASIYGSVAQGFPGIVDYTACYEELKARDILNTAYYNGLGNMSQSEKEKLVKEFITEQKHTLDRKDLSQTVKDQLSKIPGQYESTSYCKARQVITTIYSNKDLEETKVTALSVGSQIQFTDNHIMGFDLWYVKSSNIPGKYLGPALKEDVKKGKEYAEKTFNTTLNKAEELITLNDQTTKNIDVIKSISIKDINLAQSRTSGLNINWNSETNNTYFGGKPYFRNETSVILFSQAEDIPGVSGYIERIGGFGSPRWRNIATLGWQNKKHNLALQAHTKASTRTLLDATKHLPAYTRFDLDYQFVVSKKLSLQFNWTNLLFSDPPWDESVHVSFVNIDNSIHEVRGPWISARISYKM